MKILIADDDAVSRRLMERMLQQGGYEVITASNGRAAAKELLCRNGPRLALMDWMMPELDGPDICRQLRNRHEQPYVYITLLTSKHSREDIVAGLEAGADDYLIKPCDYEELKARLRTGQRILELEDKLVAAREGMRFKATHDALTSLWDRGAILACLKSELTQSLGDRTSLFLLLCDIDHFKRINDTHGHLVGDEVLREIALRLHNAVRPHDMVGRYGGEEFLLILKGCDAIRIENRAEQVRHAVASMPFLTSRGPLSISVSIGALAIHGWESASSPDSLLERVDTALYKAKAAGRDRIVYVESAAPARGPGDAPLPLPLWVRRNVRLTARYRVPT
jgi:two-component system cell cycle response regulator